MKCEKGFVCVNNAHVVKIKQIYKKVDIHNYNIFFKDEYMIRLPN